MSGESCAVVWLSGERKRDDDHSLQRGQRKEVDFIRAAGKKCSKWLDDGRKHESGWFPLEPAKLWVSFPLSVAGYDFLSRQPQVLDCLLDLV